VSLILEALKKLERDKQGPDRGFLVVAHVPWAAKARGSRLWLGATFALVLGLALAIVAWGGRRPLPEGDADPRATTPTLPPAAAAAPAPATTTLAPASLLPGVSIATPPAPAVRPTSRPETAAPAPKPPSTELRLHALTQRDGHWVAVLNDRLVREGDEFDGIRVVRIGETEVEVEVAGERRILTF
jgi:hypothetical protein